MGAMGDRDFMIEVDEPCEVCAKIGRYRPTGNFRVGEDGEIEYEHRCNNCGDIRWLEDVLPYYIMKASGVH